VVLENLPVSVSVDGVEVEGTIQWVQFNDIRVAITSPVTGQTKQLHVPYFALKLHRLTAVDEAGTTHITNYGQSLAEWMLKKLFVTSQR
jgi:hypothetical protein